LKANRLNGYAGAVQKTRPDYGIDAPKVVVQFFMIGAIAISVGIGSRAFLGPKQPLFAMGVGMGVSFLLTAILMLWGSKVGKLSLRDRVLDSLSLQGHETVLDVGCGRGLMLIGAAKRLGCGKAFGVDLWQKEDQSGNNPDVTLQNARAEGVAERIEIKTGDARALPFEANTFDVVVSSWALHNIYDAEGRGKAVQEIVRVLKPGGRAVILDIRHTAEYARVLREQQMSEVRRSWPNFTFVIPTYTLRARKPSASN
jgi:ubiquinone/menaquinone biosynthesis C-methylase UbiE